MSEATKEVKIFGHHFSIPTSGIFNSFLMEDEISPVVKETIKQCLNKYPLIYTKPEAAPIIKEIIKEAMQKIATGGLLTPNNPYDISVGDTVGFNTETPLGVVMSIYGKKAKIDQGNYCGMEAELPHLVKCSGLVNVPKKHEATLDPLKWLQNLVSFTKSGEIPPQYSEPDNVASYVEYLLLLYKMANMKLSQPMQPMQPESTKPTWVRREKPYWWPDGRVETRLLDEFTLDTTSNVHVEFTKEDSVAIIGSYRHQSMIIYVKVSSDQTPFATVNVDGEGGLVVSV